MTKISVLLIIHHVVIFKKLLIINFYDLQYRKTELITEQNATIKDVDVLGQRSFGQGKSIVWIPQWTTVI